MIRLDKFLCEAGAGSRSEVKLLIKKGRVTINGAVAKAPETKVDEKNDQVALDAQPLSYEKFVYYMLHKPAGVVTATRDNHEKTVMELLKDAPGKDLFPAGRLDKDTEGLLLITNDGALSHRLLSPAKHVDKTYLVRTKAPVTDEMRRRLEEGVDIGDEKPTLPAKTELTEDGGLLLTVTEGRSHQVKRMLSAVGNEVVYLKRLSMGPLVLDGALSMGEYRALTPEEKAALGIG